jgi:hypothetical protein
LSINPTSNPTSSSSKSSSLEASITQAQIHMFQASSTFVNACQDATMALHALTAKIKEIEKKLEPARKVKAKV